MVTDPWARFPEPGIEVAPSADAVTLPRDLVAAAAAALRASADVHDAERLPHISGGLRALADRLEAVADLRDRPPRPDRVRGREVHRARLGPPPPRGDPVTADGRQDTAGRRMTATPPQGIDRDALIALIVQDSEHESWTAEGFADRILALVRPVEGVTLTPEEAALARSWYPGDRAIENPEARALAARLEAAQ